MADFVKVARTAEGPKGGMKKVMLGTRSVVLAKVDGKYYAMESVCTHFGGPLEKGLVDGHEVQCPVAKALASI